MSSLPLKEFAQKLKTHREQQKISLHDISFSTRINHKFLEDLEEGTPPQMPETYLRAFLREYAVHINLNPEEVIEHYLRSMKHPEGTEQETSPESESTAPTDVAAEKPASKTVPVEHSNYKVQKMIVVGGIVLLVGAGAAYLFDGFTESKPPAPQEVPFNTVIEESKKLTMDLNVAVADSVPQMIAEDDTLTLVISTTDSVWISLLIDGKQSHEYLFAPRRSMTWKAKERFLISMGNAGGASFTLNGTTLGKLGRPGMVIRNIPISRADLQSRQ